MLKQNIHKKKKKGKDQVILSSLFTCNSSGSLSILIRCERLPSLWRKGLIQCLCFNKTGEDESEVSGEETDLMLLLSIQQGEGHLPFELTALHAAWQ